LHTRVAETLLVFGWREGAHTPCNRSAIHYTLAAVVQLRMPVFVGGPSSTLLLLLGPLVVGFCQRRFGAGFATAMFAAFEAFSFPSFFKLGGFRLIIV
jgi:hypothetical protein